MRICSILPVLCILLISCGKKSEVPSQFIQPSKMQLVFWDYLRADALTAQLQRSSTSSGAQAANVKLQKQVFAIHQITKEEFYNSLDYYKAHPDLMRSLMDSMLNKANKERPNGPSVINPALIK